MASAIPTLNREHIHPGDRICAAVSGGADSVALLLLLHAANALPRNGLGVGLSAVHVHHGLRGEEADADLAFVEALCLRLAVPLHVHRASVPQRHWPAPRPRQGIWFFARWHRAVTGARSSAGAVSAR